MSKKRNVVYNMPDVKDFGGSWLATYSSEKYVSCRTRSGGVWYNLTNRCNPAGSVQKNNPSYNTCENHFESFQHFAEWCQNEYGYWEKDTSGKYWSLDKDLITIGNKIYSPERCLFVPHKFNTLILSNAGMRGDLPIGCHWNTRDKKYQSNVSTLDNKYKFLGYYDIPEDAHKAWQKAKLQVIKDVAEEPIVSRHVKLRLALESRIQKLTDDLSTNRQTEYF